MKKELLNMYKESFKSMQGNRDLKTCICKYLMDICNEDEYFRKKYKPERLDSCISFIVASAKELLEGKNGEVDDNLCYKMARDYYEECIWEEEDKEKEEELKKSKEIKVEKPLSVPQVSSSSKNGFKPCSGQIDLFEGVL